MSIRKAVMFVPRRLLASQWSSAAAPAASSATEAASTLSRKQRDMRWAPVSAVAAASGAAAPLGVAAVLVAPHPKLQPLVAKLPPVDWKPAPKPLPMGIVASSALRQGVKAGRRHRPAACCLEVHECRLASHGICLPAVSCHRRKAPSRGKAVMVTSQAMHRATLHLTADCRIDTARAPPPPAATHGGVRKRPSRHRALAMLSRSLLLVGALMIAGIPPVLPA